MSQVDLLYRLQQTDDEIRQSKSRLAQVIRLQSGSSGLQSARKQSEMAKDELDKWRSKQNSQNLELTGLNDKAKREERRLYSGTVKNPKELEDIQHELESLARRRSLLEDELIESMIMVEEAEELDANAQETLAVTEATWATGQERLKSEQEELINRINELTAFRKQHLSLISTSSITAYENAIRRAGITAVVLLRKGRCNGCQVTVPINLVKSANEGHLVLCDNCSRVLCPV